MSTYPISNVIIFNQNTGYYKITDILLYILPDFVNIHIINPNNPIINLCIFGTENYELLQRMIISITNELNNLKFIAIVLDFNAPNSKHFCPWCLCTKENIRNKHNVYVIEKNMDQIKPAFFDNNLSVKLPPGYIKLPLLQMISLNHYVPDELHIMLRIWDQL
ncbi:hypothetical protein C1645_829904 [Glomus cerebriforme]|uniref:Uncharacterized protein n=1 Tax=Glomus cerebriforme TaxID=658196 RepID=A0A397SPT1_9GLOM|nr:hypothetical protein C1645_829904 [Glomus cerebriforme]